MPHAHRGHDQRFPIGPATLSIVAWPVLLIHGSAWQMPCPASARRPRELCLTLTFAEAARARRVLSPRLS